MTRAETIRAVNRALRFLFDGMQPCGLDIRMGRRRYYKYQNQGLAHYDFRHWQVIVDVEPHVLPQQPLHYSARVTIKRLYWNDGRAGFATESVQKALFECYAEKDFRNVVAAFAALKDETQAPALAGIPGAEPLMEEMLCA